MNLSWSAVDEALLGTGSRQSSINTLWRMVPEEERTPARRKLTIALVDLLREHVAAHGMQKPKIEDIESIVLGEKGASSS